MSYAITYRLYRDGELLYSHEIGARGRWRDAYELANTFVCEETIGGATLTAMPTGRTGTEYKLTYGDGTVAYVAVPERKEN